ALAKGASRCAIASCTVRRVRILLVKTSSMGDVIHNLPVVGDIHRHDSAAQIDWVVEETFSDIPALHPGVRRVIRAANRRWRKSWFSSRTLREFRAFKTELQSERYDSILDTQGLLKSALIARLARGKRCGYSASSAREPLSSRFYDATFDVAKDKHAVERNRALAGAALGYIPWADVDYGIRVFSPYPRPLPLRSSSGQAPGEREHHSSTASSPIAHSLPRGETEQQELAKQRYAVLLHATSRASKEWDEASWIALGQFLNTREIEVLLPWGSEAERIRSERLKMKLMHAFVPARMSLGKLTKLFAGAQIVIGADTGLTHLAAALGRPTIGIYRGSDPRLTGLYGSEKAVNLGEPGRAPSVPEVIAEAERFLV
ncbi:MAG: lipopolysaccharide heptosyltransferase I, partial [Burkholderiales bacterium]